MGQVGRRELDRFETEARRGVPDALFRLGLAHSTGQMFPVDLIVAHKWFNLAALKGDSEARLLRAQIAREMSTAQVAEAQRQARAWLRDEEASGGKRRSC